MDKENMNTGLNTDYAEVNAAKKSHGKSTYKPLNTFEAISIKLASPEVVNSWSHGEVLNAETVDYRTGDPKDGGLFCEKIFGPVKGLGDRSKGPAGKLEDSKVRRERMGHITLAVPVVHICLFKCNPSRLSTMLDIPAKTLQSIIYYNSYVVTECGATPFKVGQVFTKDELTQAKSDFGNSFKAEQGAPALLKLLEKLDLQKLKIELEMKLGKTLTDDEKEYWEAVADGTEEFGETGEDGKPLVSKRPVMRKKLTQRLRLVEGFINSNMRPEWMILKVLPVIPPDLRPLVPLDGGRWASSDLNDLYRHIINRNERLKKMIDGNAPQVLLDNECRMVQESVDALFDNSGSESTRAAVNGQGRQLKSLSDALKGKQGRFRQNLLGKRVDYSGRSVIVVGPELKINQCGIPKTMALTLFEPYIIRHLKNNFGLTLKGAKNEISRSIHKPDSPVWDILEHVVTGHPVMLNRAPTLHRLSIQAFDPILIEGSAIRLHPLVCTGFNADFDGDQMAVHVPLSPAAQLECKLLMLSPLNIFSPASGNPIATPTQDITLGVYYLTQPPVFPAGIEVDEEYKPYWPEIKKAGEPAIRHYLIEQSNIRPNGKVCNYVKDKSNDKHYLSILKSFGSIQEVLFALAGGHLKMHDAVLLPNPDFGASDEDVAEKGLKVRPRGKTQEKYIITTPGRCIFNGIWDKCLGFWNDMPKADPEKKGHWEGGVIKKKEMGKLIAENYKYVGHLQTVELLDRLKNLGYEYATVAGYSISIADMKVPKEKQTLIDAAREEVARITTNYLGGGLTNNERHNMVTDVWSKTSIDVANALFDLSEREHRKSINSLYSMLDSGARGSKDQIRQLAGMRGLMAKPNGEIIERPILSNFREGLSVLEYFISTHGARKGLADTALKTASSGYMTRKLVDVAQDIICRCEDCGSKRGITIQEIPGPEKPLMTLKDRLVGRYSAQDIIYQNEVLIHAGEEFTPAIVDKMQKCGINKAIIRSVLTCDVEHGVCQKCYGKNLATDKDAEIGDSLGIIAAQSIGEPGTQLTMRTFHIGGTASAKAKEARIKASYNGTIFWDNIRVVECDPKDMEEQDKENSEEKENKPVKKSSKEKQTVVVNTNGTIIIYDKERAKTLAAEKQKSVEEEAKIMGTPINEEYDYMLDAIHDCKLESFIPEGGTIIHKKNGDSVKIGDVIGEWDPYKVPIISEVGGWVEWSDLILNVSYSVKKRGDNEEYEVTKHRDDITPAIIVHSGSEDDPSSSTIYPLQAGAILNVTKGAIVKPGAVLARFPRQEQKTQDITGGLPRVSELFEAHQPKDIAVIAEMSGYISEGKLSHGKKQYFITEDPNLRIEYSKDDIAKDSSLKNKTIEHMELLIPPTKHMLVSKGDRVEKGQKLTFGSIRLPDLLKVCGEQELQRYLVNEVQSVYRSQGVEISDKHIEIIIRQMMQKRKIINPGDTRFLEDEEVDRYELEHENERIRAVNGIPASSEPMLQGIAKASLTTESFISSASFQDTTRILTDAATLGKVDTLRGFKENVITGHLIPAGTGAVRLAGLHPKAIAPAVMPPWRPGKHNVESIATEMNEEDERSQEQNQEDLRDNNITVTYKNEKGEDIAEDEDPTSDALNSILGGASSEKQDGLGDDFFSGAADEVNDEDIDDSEAYKEADEDGNV